MIAFPNAKINLGLKVVEKRPDGFHNIETVFYPIPLYDILEILPATPSLPGFITSGLPIPGPDAGNLCLKARDILQASFPAAFSSSPAICLHKQIPMGAGLGGGSSDGVFALKMLDALFSLNAGQDKLRGMAAVLGSDCPFFLYNKPVFAQGRGDVFSDVTVNLRGYKLVVVVPPVHVSTAEAYSMLKPARPEIPVSEIVQAPVEEWKDRLDNDFEKPVFEKYPLVREVKERLYASGAIYASMSGSGSAVFGLFPRGITVDTSFPGDHFVFSSDL